MLFLCLFRLAIAVDTTNIVDSLIYMSGPISQFGAQTPLVYVYNISSQQWCPARPLPVSKSSYASVVYNGKVYFIGGDLNGNCTDDVVTFDPLTNTFQNEQPIPEKLCYARAVVAGGKMFVVGNSNFIGTKRYNRNPFLIFDGHAWTSGSIKGDYFNETELQGFTLSAYKNIIYITGGGVYDHKPSDNWVSNTVVYFDTADERGSWMWGPRFPGTIIQTLRTNHAAAVLDNFLYVCGGSTIDPVPFWHWVTLDSCVKLELDENTGLPKGKEWSQDSVANLSQNWSTGIEEPPNPYPRTRFSLLPYNGTLLALGGTAFSGGIAMMDDIEQYFPNTNKWHELGEWSANSYVAGATGVLMEVPPGINICNDT